LRLIESGSARFSIEIDGSEEISLSILRGEIRVYLWDLQFTRLLLKLGILLRPGIIRSEQDTRDIGLLEGLKMLKSIAKELAASNQTVTVIYRDKEILKVGKCAKPLIMGLILKHVEVIDKMKTMKLLATLFFRDD